MATLLISRPLDHTYLSLAPMKYNNDGESGSLLSSVSENHNHLAEERLLVREMVDGHAQYLSTVNPVRANLLQNSNNNTAISWGASI